MESSMDVTQKTKNTTTIPSSNAPPGHIFKKMDSRTWQSHLYTHVYSHKEGTKVERIKRGYELNWDIIHMYMENFMLSKVSQAQKSQRPCFSSYMEARPIS
jgi:hypothetical protein